MRAGGIRLVLTGLMIAAAASGCGFGLQITATPTNPHGGHTVTFDVKLTNHSQCPSKGMVEVVPFLTPTEIQQFISGEPHEGYQFLLNVLCSGSASYQGITCTLTGDLVTCDFPVPPDTNPDATGQSFAINLPGFSQPITCVRGSNTLHCNIPKAELSQLAPVASSETQAAAVTCQSVSGGLICPISDVINPGGMENFQFTAKAPYASGTYSTIAVAIPSGGVCEGGTTPGAVCDNNLDCGQGTVCNGGTCSGGTTPGSTCTTDEDCAGAKCRTSICQNGTNPGEGCRDGSTCLGGGSCVSCDSGLSRNGTTGYTPIGCAEVSVTGLAAPAASQTGLAVLALILGGLGAVWLVRSRRRV